MIMFTITKPKRKLKKLFMAAALVLLLSVAVPGAYFTLSDAGAMSLFASGEAVEQPPDAAPNAAADAAAASDGQADENIQPEQAEQTAGAADTADEVTEDTADTAAAAEPGFWARLRAVFFGEEPQVIPY